MIEYVCEQKASPSEGHSSSQEVSQAQTTKFRM